MNKVTSNLIHAFIHQEADADGRFTAHRQYKRDGVRNTAFNGSVFYHYDAAVGYLLHPRKKNKPVILFYTAIKGVERGLQGLDEFVSSKTTKEVCDLLRVSVDGQVAIGIPDTVLDDYCFTSNEMEQMTPAMLARWHGERIDSFLERFGTMFRTEKDVTYLVRVLNDARNLNKLYKGAVTMKLVNKVQKDLDAYYSARKVCGVRCTSYEDYAAKLEKLHEMKWEYNRVLIETQRIVHRCETLYNYCLNNGGKAEHLAARAAKIIDDMKKLDQSCASTVRQVSDIYAKGRYYDLSRLITIADRARYYYNTDEGNKALIDVIHGLDPVNGYSTATTSEKAFINYDKNGKRTISTTKGVDLTPKMTEAIRAVVEAIQEGEDVTGRHVGPYTVREHSAKWLRVGCHAFRMPFVKKFCELYLLDRESYETRKHELFGDWDGTGAFASDELLKLMDALQQVAHDLFDENYVTGASKEAVSDASSALRELTEARTWYNEALNAMDEMKAKFKAMYDEDGKLLLA